MFLAYRKIKQHRARKAAEAAQATQATPATSTTQAATTDPSQPSSSASVPNASLATPKRKCSQCTQEKSAHRKYRWKLLLCLMPAFFVASLDLTIVATALPQIASHFDKFNELNWIVTAFTLTSTAFVPVFGQLSDIFGRYATLQFALILLIIGSVLCAATPVWAVLLLGRALQGMGTAGIQNVTLIVLADSVSLRDQAVNTSIFQVMNGVGYSVGPVIGGYLTNTDWRYCFVLGAGVSVLSLATMFLLRNDLKPGRISLWRPVGGQTRFHAFSSGVSTLDIGGITLFIFGVGLIILGTAWGGSTFPWNSGAVISTIVLGAVLIVAFGVYEMLLEPGRLLNRTFPKTVPMIPASILRSKDVTLVCFIGAATGAALYSVFYFIGIYFTLVEAYAASKAGTQLLYYVPGIGVGVYTAMFICNVFPRQTFLPLCSGTIIETAGIATLAYAVKARNATLVNVMMAIAGVGTGMRFMPSNLHLAGMFRDRLAAVYSLLRFSLPFGGTLALTIMGSVFQNKMSEYFGSSAVNSNNGGSSNLSLQNQASIDGIKNLPIAEQNAIRAQGATATMWAFISILPILAISLLASIGLGNVWISKRKSSDTSAEEEKGEVRPDGLCQRHANVEGPQDPAAVESSGVEFITSVYLLALLRGNVRQLKRSAVVKAPVSGAGAHLQNKLDEGLVSNDPASQAEFGETRESAERQAEVQEAK